MPFPTAVQRFSQPSQVAGGRSPLHRCNPAALHKYFPIVPAPRSGSHRPVANSPPVRPPACKISPPPRSSSSGMRRRRLSMPTAPSVECPRSFQAAQRSVRFRIVRILLHRELRFVKRFLSIANLIERKAQLPVHFGEIGFFLENLLIHTGCHAGFFLLF